MAVSSSSPAVAARCAHAKAGVGVVASQNITDPRLGPKTLLAMAEGHSAPEAVKMIINAAENADFRQVLAVDATGKTAIYSGSKSLDIHADFASQNAAAAGNLLANPNIPKVMVTAFHQGTGHLGDRLIECALHWLLVARLERCILQACYWLVSRNGQWQICDATGLKIALSRQLLRHGIFTSRKLMTMSHALLILPKPQVTEFRAMNRKPLSGYRL